MDFFREQDIARRNTRLLTALFILAVLALIAITNLLFLGLLLFETGGNGASDLIAYLDWSSFFAVGAVVALIIGLVALVNWFNFARGGKQIANALGGTLVQPSTEDPLERRAANIVQEMALAANMPVPSLFILEEEAGINAFAAGITPADAIVAVTRGSIEQLKRHELQGVVAHEFSHILNGDMRLNIRMMGVLFGIMVLALIGRLVVRGSRHGRLLSRRDKNAPAILIIGLGFLILGYVGMFFARVIKAGVSRQREYLADASAVQFTRQTEGIANALKKIGGYDQGSRIQAADPEEVSHMLFGSGSQLGGL